MQRKNALWVSLIAILFFATGCQATVEVLVEVEEGGSGVVRAELFLDREATDALLDLNDGSTLQLADLAQASWTIGPPEVTEDDRTRITAEKAFGTPSEFAEIMMELSDNRIFQDFALTRSQSFGQVDYGMTGIIDTTEGLAAFGDPALETALGQSLISIVGGPPYNTAEEDIALTVRFVLPGQLQEEGSNGEIGATDEFETEARWDALLSDREQQSLTLTTTRRSTSAQVLRGVAVVAGALAALIAFAQLLRIVSGLRRPNPSPRVRPTDARGRPTTEPTGEQAVVEVEEDPVESSTGYRVVALDGMGVLYREGDDVHNLLIPFARERGSAVPDDEIVVKARQLSLGRMTPADFWKLIGVEGDPNELDTAYLATHQLMPGVVKYLRSLRDSGLRVACITNDAAAWATKLRGSHSLEGLVDPWVVSGSVGVRKPDAPLFEVLRRVVGEPAGSILVVDDDLANLDTARDMGFGTAWFSADGERADARGHELFRSFDAVTIVSEASEEDGRPDGQTGGATSNGDGD
ncbi:MAG: HAD-IA family hydrolase [Actinomycetota bacterium]